MMLLSRFWYVLLSLLLTAAVVSLFIAQSMYNRAGSKVLAEGLSSDSQTVSWYMRNASRERAGQLIKFALNPKIAKALADSTRNDAEVPRSARDDANSEVAKIAGQLPPEFALDAVFVVDRHGRVVGQHGYPQSTAEPNFELGGYPLVADALHGYIRDDTLSWDGLYLAVARPVEMAAGEEPVGAVLGVIEVDDQFAADISTRTGALIAFYAGGERIAAGAPPGQDRSHLDGIVSDFQALTAEDKDYADKGRSNLRYLTPTFGVVYAKLPGEAWQRGAGYAVGRQALTVRSPVGFFGMADDKDKASANVLVVILILGLGVGLGILFTLLEHTRPLNRFKALSEELASNKVSQLQVSKVSGVYRKIASNINDGIDHAVAKGGGSRRAADLNQVLGASADQPAMSAFSFPEPDAVTKPEPAAPAPLPRPPGGKPPVPRRGGMAATMPEAGIPAPPAAPGSNESHASEWRRIYEEFLAAKRQCGEPTDGLTYEKFEVTLRKNRDAITQRHHVTRVKFSVYVKDGKAALKANPVRD
jgi:hypothetical protein